MTSYKTQQQRKAINAFLNSSDCPPVPENTDPIRFGKMCLDNYLNKQLDKEAELAYEDFYGPLPEKISDNYDLGAY